MKQDEAENSDAKFSDTTETIKILPLHVLFCGNLKHVMNKTQKKDQELLRKKLKNVSTAVENIWKYNCKDKYQ